MSAAQSLLGEWGGSLSLPTTTTSAGGTQVCVEEVQRLPPPQPGWSGDSRDPQPAAPALLLCQLVTVEPTEAEPAATSSPSEQFEIEGPNEEFVTVPEDVEGLALDCQIPVMIEDDYEHIVDDHQLEY